MNILNPSNKYMQMEKKDIKYIFYCQENALTYCQITNNQHRVNQKVSIISFALHLTMKSINYCTKCLKKNTFLRNTLLLE